MYKFIEMHSSYQQYYYFTHIQVKVENHPILFLSRAALVGCDGQCGTWNWARTQHDWQTLKV
jgi:hypothetical protein